MSNEPIPQEFLELIQKITNKRAKIVIDHIIQYGHITTEELEKDYGYNHPPRAARDVREAGVPIITFTIKSKDGTRNIAAYKFGSFSDVKKDRIQGRLNWPKKFKETLIAKYGSKDMISNANLESRALQIDHRIPYQVVGDDPNATDLDPNDFMLLSGTSNRAKSWSCEHCQNWLEINDPEICKQCYWAYPEDYSHIAMNEIRRAELTWQGDEISEYDYHKGKSAEQGVDLPKYIKEILKRLRR